MHAKFIRIGLQGWKCWQAWAAKKYDQLGQELPEITPARDGEKELLSMKQEACAFMAVH